MTEQYEDDSLVKVRAQVMTRDESTEGWLPLQGGGLANVSIRKRARMADVGGHEYIIYAQRISDQTVILSCVINRDLQYYKVMPTFHHWRAGKQRNGLTFQTAADARAFDKGIIKAYDDLIDGLSQKWDNDTKNNCNYDDTQVGEDDVFMTLDLPLETSESKSSSEGTGSNPSVEKQPSMSLSHPPRIPGIQYISGELTSNYSNNTDSNSLLAPTTQPSCMPADYSYVQLAGVGEFRANNYSLPEDPLTASVLRRDSTDSLKKRVSPDVTDSIMKDPVKPRLRCRHCEKFYQEVSNRKGSCSSAPDCVKSGIETISGMKCARGMLYHCMSDSEGDIINQPCSCNVGSGDEVSCTKRWIGLALLSLCVPCLCLYPPLKACHMIGIACGVCGAKHKPQI